jgi:hypothetical protein
MMNEEEEETECPDSPDGAHCNHWYDGDQCCYCQLPRDEEYEK